MSLKSIWKFSFLLMLITILTMSWLVSATPALATTTWDIDSVGQAYSIRDSLFNCEATVGSGDDPEDISYITFSGENNSFSLRINITIPQIEFAINADTLTLGNDKILHRIYHKSSAELEWEVVLEQQPDSGDLTFPIVTEGLRFFYQDPDTLYKYRDEINFADNVPGSYAVYASGNCNHVSGKLFHIYRPYARDNDGKTATCELQIDTTANMLTIAVPDSFIEAADYPITVDPTIGYTTHGQLGRHLGASDFRHLVNYGDYENAVGAMHTAHICGYRNDANAACTVTVAVYTYDPTLADCEKVATSAKAPITEFAIDPGDAEWVATPISGELAADTEYLVSWQGFESCDYCLRVCADYTGIWGYERYYDYPNWGTNDDLGGYSSDSYVYSVYIEYQDEASVGDPFIRCRKLKRSGQ